MEATEVQGVGGREGADQPRATNLAPEPIYLSHEDGRDAVKYRRAKALAEAEGRSIVFLPPAPAPAFEPPADTVVIPKDASPATYRRLKAEAQARGLAYMVHP